MSAVGGNQPDRLGKLFSSNRSKAVDASDTCWQKFTDIFKSAAGKIQANAERTGRRAFRAEVWAAKTGGDDAAAWAIVEKWDTETHEHSTPLRAGVVAKDDNKSKAFQHELKKITTIGRASLTNTRRGRVTAEGHHSFLASKKGSEAINVMTKSVCNEAKRLLSSLPTITKYEKVRADLDSRLDRIDIEEAEAKEAKKAAKTAAVKAAKSFLKTIRVSSKTSISAEKANSLSMKQCRDGIETLNKSYFPDHFTDSVKVLKRALVLKKLAKAHIQEHFGRGVKQIGEEEAYQLTGAQCKKFLRVLKGLPEYESSCNSLRERRLEARESEKYLAGVSADLTTIIQEASEASVDKLADNIELLEEVKDGITNENPKDIPETYRDLIQQGFQVTQRYLDLKQVKSQVRSRRKTRLKLEESIKETRLNLEESIRSKRLEYSKIPSREEMVSDMRAKWDYLNKKGTPKVKEILSRAKSIDFLSPAAFKWVLLVSHPDKFNVLWKGSSVSKESIQDVFSGVGNIKTQLKRKPELEKEIPKLEAQLKELS